MFLRGLQLSGITLIKTLVRDLPSFIYARNTYILCIHVCLFSHLL